MKKNDFSAEDAFLSAPSGFAYYDDSGKTGGTYYIYGIDFFNRIYSGTWCTVPETVVILFDTIIQRMHPLMPALINTVDYDDYCHCF